MGKSFGNYFSGLSLEGHIDIPIFLETFFSFIPTVKITSSVATRNGIIATMDAPGVAFFVRITGTRIHSPVTKKFSNTNVEQFCIQRLNQFRRSRIICLILPSRSKKAGRFEKLLGFARSPSIVIRGSVSLSCATIPHPSCFFLILRILYF